MSQNFNDESLSAEQENKKRPGCFRSGCLLLLLAGLFFLGGFYVLCLYTPPLHISEETTRITEPIRADGQIDFFKAYEKRVYPPELATDENGYRLFVQKFGDVASEIEITHSGNKSFYVNQKAEKLGLDPTKLPPVNFPVDPQDEVLKADQEKIKRIGKPWTLDDLPEMSDWIREAEQPLNETAEMLRKPVFRGPCQHSPEAESGRGPQDMIAMQLHDTQFYRSLARMFSARANYLIGQGDIDGAIEDNISLLHLARKPAQNGVLIEFLVGLALEGVALNIPIAGNPEHQPSKEQLQKLWTALDEIPPFMSLEQSYECERIVALATLQNITNGDNTSDYLESLGSGGGWTLWASRLCDPNILFRETNIAFDMLVGKLPKDDYHDNIAPPEMNPSLFLNLLTVPRRSKIGAKTFLSIMMPAMEIAAEAVRRNHCSVNLKRLQLALMMYKADQGAFPGEDWIEKIKPYLGAEPEQYFRCSSNKNPAEGSQYALVLYEKSPASLDSLLLVEVLNPLPFDRATIKPGDFLHKNGSIGSLHRGGLNFAKRDGSVGFLSTTAAAEERERLVGIEKSKEETPEETDENGPE